MMFKSCIRKHTVYSFRLYLVKNVSLNVNVVLIKMLMQYWYFYIKLGDIYTYTFWEL